MSTRMCPACKRPTDDKVCGACGRETFTFTISPEEDETLKPTVSVIEVVRLAGGIYAISFRPLQSGDTDEDPDLLSILAAASANMCAECTKTSCAKHPNYDGIVEAEPPDVDQSSTT